MSYTPASPDLLEQYKSVLEDYELNGSTNELKTRENNIALKIRSRLIDLSAWKADNSDEYYLWEKRCSKLVQIADEFAHDYLISEFRNGA